MRPDVEILFVGGILDGEVRPMSKTPDDKGELRPPRFLMVGEPVSFLEFARHVALGTVPEAAGQYLPCGITDAGRLAYIWHENHG